MSNRELVRLSSVELRRRIGTKEISPVELLEACLERIEAINPAVSAVTAMCVPRVYAVSPTPLIAAFSRSGCAMSSPPRAMVPFPWGNGKR